MLCDISSMELYLFVHKPDFNNNVKCSVYKGPLFEGMVRELRKYGYSHVNEDDGILETIFLYDFDWYNKSEENGFYRYVFDAITPMVREIKINSIL